MKMSNVNIDHSAGDDDYNDDNDDDYDDDNVAYTI